MNTSIKDVNTYHEDFNTYREGCYAYTFQTIDGLFTCQLHPSHFGFLQNYTSDENPIELFDITQKEVDEGIKLFQHYLVFHELMNDLLSGTKVPEKKEMKTVMKAIENINQNSFLDWLQLKMAENEIKMMSLINETEQTCISDCVCEYYWFRYAKKNNLTQSFWSVCAMGQLNIAMWLLLLEPTHEKIDIHAFNGYVFGSACYNGHLEVAQWLISLEPTHGKINIHAEHEFAFKYACENGHFEVAKWLLSLEPTHGRIMIGFDKLIKSCNNENIKQLLKTTKHARMAAGPTRWIILKIDDFNNCH